MIVHRIQIFYKTIWKRMEKLVHQSGIKICAKTSFKTCEFFGPAHKKHNHDDLSSRGTGSLSLSSVQHLHTAYK